MDATTKAVTDATAKTGWVSCTLCCEEKQRLCFFSRCGHGCCEVCAFRWIGKEETTGQPSPTCPFCRSELAKEDVVAILGRDFCPNKQQQNAGNIDDVEMDELTRHLIEEQTTPCPSCGVRIAKSDGCDLMECLCGFRFCYSCGSPGARCNCTPSHHYYWDNILDVQAPRQAPARARIDEETGQIDLARYIRNEESRRRFVQKHKHFANVLERLLPQKRVDMRLCQSPAYLLDDATVVSICVGRRKLAKKINSYPYYRLHSHLRLKQSVYWQMKDGEPPHDFDAADFVTRRFLRPRRISRRRRFNVRHRFTMRRLEALQLQRLGDMTSALGEGDTDNIFERCFKRRKLENKKFQGHPLFRRRNITIKPTTGLPRVRQPDGGLTRETKLDRELYHKRQAAGGGISPGSLTERERNWKETLSSIGFFRGLLRGQSQNNETTTETECDA